MNPDEVDLTEFIEPEKVLQPEPPASGVTVSYVHVTQVGGVEKEALGSGRTNGNPCGVPQGGDFESTEGRRGYFSLPLLRS